MGIGVRLLSRSGVAPFGRNALTSQTLSPTHFKHALPPLCLYIIVSLT